VPEEEREEALAVALVQRVVDVAQRRQPSCAVYRKRPQARR
jgi:hypothetical protein